MIKFIKENIFYIIIIIICSITSVVSASTISGYLFQADEVEYDNTDSGMQSNNVQDAIEELYTCAINYNDYKERLESLSKLISNNSAASHNGIYRGKNIGSYYSNGSLYTRISSGEFTDLYIGDYFTTSLTGVDITWRIAAFDPYLNKGDALDVTSHHAAIVPDAPLTNAVMNSTATSEGGFAGTVGDAPFRGPQDGLVVEAVFVQVREGSLG